MKKNTLILIGFLLLNGSLIFGQSQSDSIQIKKILGTVFIQNGKKLTPKQLLEITKINSEAYNEMKVAKSNYGIGTGLIVVSIPFSTSYTKHAKKAVGIYNNGLAQTGLRKIDFNLALTCNGIGIKMTF